MTKKPMTHKGGREAWEDSEERYYDGIGSPNQADRMICLAEEGQVLPEGTTWSPSTLEPFLDDDGNLSGTKNQHPSKNATTAVIISGCLV